MSVDLLVCGIVVFVLLLVGVGLTIVEFNQIK
jgi:hypothetical protein